MRLEGLEPAEPLEFEVTESPAPAMPGQPTQLWALKVTASGFVSDADGNVISGDIPVEFDTITITDAQARQILEGNDPQ